MQGAGENAKMSKSKITTWVFVVTTKFQSTWLQGVVNTYRNFVPSTPTPENTAEIIRLALMAMKYVPLVCNKKSGPLIHVKPETVIFLQKVLLRHQLLGSSFFLRSSTEMALSFHGWSQFYWRLGSRIVCFGCWYISALNFSTDWLVNMAL